MKRLYLFSFAAMIMAGPVFAQTDNNTTGNTTESWQQISQTGATPATNGDCASNVQTQIGNLQKQFIAGQDEMGSNGYTTDDFTDNSCLSNLLGSLNVNLSPPNLSQILNELENAVCNKAQEAEQNAVAPLEQEVSGGQSQLGDIPSYQLIPGISTGATSGGVSFSKTSGYGQNPVTLNIAGGLDNGSYHSSTSFGGGLIQDITP